MTPALQKLVNGLSPNLLNVGGRQMIPTGWHILSFNVENPELIPTIDEIMHTRGMGRWAYIDATPSGLNLVVGFEFHQDSVMIKLSI